MIPWPWLIPAASAGAVLGFFLCACLAVGAREDKYYEGRREGREDAERSA